MWRALSLVLGVLVLLALAWNPDAPEGDSPQQRLVGTWLREYDENGAHVRRVLVLQDQGRFDESSRDVVPGQPDALHRHQGRWIFDGTNLKRHYTLLDGKAPSAPVVPFATFELKFNSNHEFIGRDHVHRREVLYRRVPDGTQP
ncbi:MAG: hypothetical protein HYX47_04395 [Burkholderiales bacterium]|nr:hypothetical protein [Burkholderiales bacterium]